MDEEDLVASNAGDDDLSLPKATVGKIIQEMLPEDIGCSKESRDIIVDCCVEFIHLLASEANEVCGADSKKTIAGEHIFKALEKLGFAGYVDEVKKSMDDHLASKPTERKRSGLLQSGLSEEELKHQQELLFNQAKQKYEASQH